MVLFGIFELILIVVGCVPYANCVHSVDKFILVELKGVRNNLEAAEIARENRLKFVEKLTEFENVYLFESSYVPKTNEKRSKPGQSLQNDQRVLWASQQKPLRRFKRDFLDDEDYFQLDYASKNDVTPAFNDELWDQQQWYMAPHVDRNTSRYLDLNVLPVYEAGITGYGVRVAVLDDGIEYDHEDLIENYDPEISWNLNDDTPDAYPNFRDSRSHHGTRCAGEIAMMANNKKCGVGIAFNAKLGGIKLLGGQVYDMIEGRALGFRNDQIDIYSASWGPADDGKTLEKPGLLAMKALQRGVMIGRRGLGNIYVWASGNGGKRDDNCNCDGYAASIYTITVGSVTEKGARPWYSEQCASLMTVTQSSGYKFQKSIATTDVNNRCTVKHSGTSASAPLAAGIIALALEANPSLTWRDVQHLIVRSANYHPLRKNFGWRRNGAGHYFNTQFGFGLMDAARFVDLAKTFQRVAWQREDHVHGKPYFQNDTRYHYVLFEYKRARIESLEHVKVNVNVKCETRGKLKMILTSPSGMAVNILEPRTRDLSGECFEDWSFLSVATWGEYPVGNWSLRIYSTGRLSSNIVNIGKIRLELYGTRRRTF